MVNREIIGFHAIVSANDRIHMIVRLRKKQQKGFFQVAVKKPEGTAIEANPAGESVVIPANNRCRRPSVRMSDYAYAGVKQQSAIKDGIEFRSLVCKDNRLHTLHPLPVIHYILLTDEVLAV